jgi:hypothetical protein
MKSFRLLTLTLALGTLLAGTNSHAIVSRNMTYRESLIWRCAIRLIRVDLGYQLIEKDIDSGYLLFEYKESDRLMTGSIEILPVESEGRRFVRVQINLTNQPSYVESVLYNKLERKLKSEYGQPPEAEKIEPPVDSRKTEPATAPREENRHSRKAEEDAQEAVEEKPARRRRSRDRDQAPPGY